MKKSLLSLLAGLIVLTGCAHHYVLRLNSGSEILTASKPKLKDGVYEFKDARGEEHLVPVGRVREIAPASIAQREDRPRPMKVEPPPTKKHWYLLWLG
jgi:hypothetical protein